MKSEFLASLLVWSHKILVISDKIWGICIIVPIALQDT